MTRRTRTPRLSMLLLSVLAALPMLASTAPAAQATADEVPAVERFSYESWDVEMHVALRGDGHATARVTERIVAEFPEHDQNRGMIRLIPQDYLGASTDPRDITVTDAAGDAVPFDLESGEDVGAGADAVAILTGTDDFVHGTQTYVISYALDDVILSRDDQQADELYWDMIPLNRAQPIDAATVSVTFDPALAEHLTGEQRCYVGAHESTRECAIAAPTTAAPGTLTVDAGALPAHEGLTVAIGLAPGTVTQPAARLPNFALDTLPLLVGGGAVLVSGAGVLSVARLRRSRRGEGAIIAQYDVPAELPPLLAGPIAGAAKPTPPAELVHLALRGVTRIEELPGKNGKRARKPQLAFRLLDPARVGDPLDAAAVTAVFPARTVGDLFPVPEEDSAFSDRMTGLATAGSDAALERGYVERARSPLGRVLGWVSLGLTAVCGVFIVLGIATRSSDTPAITILLAAITLVLGIVSLVPHRVLTPRGAEARRYLLGVKEFIRVAEADRLAMLQSVATAERRDAGEHSVIELYERLLPYAMLFGLEKEWGKTLATRYAQEPHYLPLWYPGMLAGGFDRLDASISQFSSSISAAATYSASSSGGSTGGGFAGGGGGGGFAGGR